MRSVLGQCRWWQSTYMSVIAITENRRIGAPNTNRTCDLPLRRGLLYPLSYRGDRGILLDRRDSPRDARECSLSSAPEQCAGLLLQQPLLELALKPQTALRE